MGQIVKFAILTGLRPGEVIESVKLLAGNNKFATVKYYNPERQALEHFRFPEIFLRRTKKAYISFITKEQLSGIAQMDCKPPTYNAIRLACQHRGLNMDMRFCRKVHGSWLHQHGLTAEEVDFLQGRSSISVFSRHYLTPNSSLNDRVIAALEKLKQEIEQ